MEMLVCKKCGQEKALSMFTKNKSKKAVITLGVNLATVFTKLNTESRMKKKSDRQKRNVMKPRKNSITNTIGKITTSIKKKELLIL